MTNNALSRGNDIQDEIRELKNAIIEVNRQNFINESSRSCSGYNVNPFLSNLHVELEKEFASL